MAVALIALFIALGGPGYAATVGSALFAKRADHARYADRAGSARKAGTATHAKFAKSAKRAGKVDGFNASATPIPRTLLALGANGRFPPSVLPTTRVVFRRAISQFVTDGDFTQARVGCAAGETLVSGGGGFIRSSDGRLDPRTSLSVSAPVADANAKVLDDGVAAALWQAAGRNLTGDWARLLVYAGCAPTS